MIWDPILNHNTSKPKSVIKIRLKKIKESYYGIYIINVSFGENEVKKKPQQILGKGLIYFVKK